MKKDKNESYILGKILEKICPKIEATVLREPKWGIAGRITFKNGRHSYFRFNTLDLNPMGSSEISKDKDYANFFIEKLGFPTIPGSKTFFSPEWANIIKSPDNSTEAAYEYAKKLGFPVVVKPNSGSQGAGVAFASNKKELQQSLKQIFKSDRIAIIQQPVSGKDYRLVVLDDEVISAYERVPLSVTGDGKSTILQLLQLKQLIFAKQHRDTRIKVTDPRIKNKLRNQKLTLLSILPKNEKIFLLDNANLSTGGDSVDVTSKVHPDFKKIAVSLTKNMGLRLCGVDLMVAGDIESIPKQYWVIEINSAPGLDHYVKTGLAQKKLVEDLYLKVIQRLDT